MKASEMIARVERKHDNSIDLIDKISYINSIEKNIYSQIVVEPYEELIDLVSGQEIYVLDGFLIEDIIQLKVGTIEYTLGSALIKQDRTYFKKNGSLCLKPIPNQSILNGMTIIRRWKPDAITEDNYEDRDLLLPDDFLEAYEYYMRAQIALEQKDAAEFNAYSGLYNGVIEEFAQWYMPKQPNMAAYKTNQRWAR